MDSHSSEGEETVANLKKSLPSGAVLEVTLAPFQEGHALFKAVARELEAVPLAVGVKVKNLKELFEAGVSDEILNTLKNVAARLIASDLVEQALWPCMSRATYNQNKIRPDVFEDEKARGDFLIVAKEVLVYNLGPFSSSLGSLFKGDIAGIGSSPA